MARKEEIHWREFKVDGCSAPHISLFPNNSVKSTRYTKYSILPKNLFEQFQRTSNIWFLLVSVFQLIPLNLNPTDSWSTIVPLAILLFFTLAKDAIDDLYRSKDDDNMNSMEYDCWSGSSFEKIKSKDIIVGNIILLNEGGIVPADMILLSSGSESQYPYLDTNGIIGNSDSNQKKIIPDLQRLLAPGDGDLALRKLQGNVYVEEPNKDFARFKGKIKLHGFPKALEIGIEQALFRGGVIGGVPWVIGLVAFAGHETKTLLNTKSPTKKTSEVEKKINKWVLFILLVLVGLNVFSILAYYYLSNDDYSQDSLVQIFITFTLLYNNIIPISLFVSIDIIRVLQVIYIQYSMNKKIGFKTGDINENLGQIEYVVVDKSGTITENEYILQCISVEDEQYVRYHNYERSYSNADEDKPLFHNINNKDSTFQLADSLEVQHIVPVENTLEKLRRKALAQKEGIKWKLLKCITLCNSVVPSGDQYHGPLAEEIALVTAAEELGFKLILRSIELCEIEINGRKEEFTILGSKEKWPHLIKP